MHPNKENFLSLDLELNQPSGKIIQIGACVGNIYTGEILEKLSLFINPNEQLTPFIINLTKIKQEDVDSGILLLEGYNKLKELHKKYNCFVNPITWGGGDSDCLKKQLEQQNENWCFGRRWIDVKTLYVSWRLVNNKPPVGGLSRSMKNLGLQFNGCAHRADDDAINTFYTYRKLLELLKDKE